MSDLSEHEIEELLDLMGSGAVIAKREWRFGVRLNAALDILFPRLFRGVGKCLCALPPWLTGATPEEKQKIRGWLNEKKMSDFRTPEPDEALTGEAIMGGEGE